MNETNPILSVDNLQISFAGDTALVAVDHLSFALHKGKTLAIVGESGSGKSLTSLALMGLLPPTARVQGTMTLRANDAPILLNNLAAHEWPAIRGKAISMVFQEPMSALNPVMKIGVQLAESIAAHQSIAAASAKETALHWLARVQLPMPEALYDRYPHQLSGGQKQRVMIAMAMSGNPALLIADEPTTALDVTVQKEILQLMRTLQAQSATSMIFITHDLALAAEMADDVLVLYRGKMMEYGPAATVFHTPANNYTKALIACRPAAQQKGKRLPVVADFLDNKSASSIPEVPPVIISDKALLTVSHLRVWYPTATSLWGRPTAYFKAVEDVSFELKQGEVLGLVGESGCGKSTVSRCLMGLQAIHSGQILFEGQDLASLHQADWQQVRRRIQMIFQDPFGSLNPRLTIGDMIMEPMRVHGIVPVKDLQREALRLLDLVQLPADAFKRYAHQFSGGQRQRVGIARALALRPQVLICDESVSALDVSVQAQILNLLKDLQHEFQLSYLFISHDLNVVHYLADRIMVMQAGQIVEAGTADAVIRHPQNDYTRRLIAAIPAMQ